MLRGSGILIIFMSFLLAFILTILPLPHSIVLYRPAWLLLVTLYWVIYLPQYVGVIIAWINGLLLDSFQSTLLGENALCFALLAYIAFKLDRQLRMLSLPFQMMVIFFLLLINQFLLFWFQGMQDQLVSVEWLLGGPIVSTLLWPWVNNILTGFVTRYKIGK